MYLQPHRKKAVLDLPSMERDSINLGRSTLLEEDEQIFQIIRIHRSALPILDGRPVLLKILFAKMAA